MNLNIIFNSIAVKLLSEKLEETVLFIPVESKIKWFQPTKKTSCYCKVRKLYILNSFKIISGTQLFQFLTNFHILQHWYNLLLV